MPFWKAVESRPKTTRKFPITLDIQNTCWLESALRKTVLFLLAVLIAQPAFSNPVQDLWGSDTCNAVHEAMSLDPGDTGRSPAEYAGDLAMMASAFGFLHGYAVANGWHEVEGFDYVSDFQETCAEFPDRPPLMILIHLF